MNTTDRSVESFDFALRRRFRWEEVTSDTELLRCYLSGYQNLWIKLADNLESLNERIAKEPLLGDDYQIGHAYLMDLKYPKSLTVTEVRSRVWDDCIRPLLHEYLRGTGKEKELINIFAGCFGVN
jgi:5-methylcytosine-specific restriction protein B